METLGAVAGCWGMPQGMVHVRLKVPKSGESGRNTWRYLEILGDTWRLVDVHRPESPRVASFHFFRISLKVATKFVL